MSTNMGITKAILSLDERIVEQFKNYDKHDGLQSNEFNTRSYHKTANGKMVFGGIKGFNIFHPDSIKDNPHIPPVVFTDLHIRYQSIAFGEPGSPLQKHISATDAITLPYVDNVFAFEFAALDYSAPEKNLYSFKMENFNKEWSKPNHDRKALYTNLNPGEYVFRVRGSNADGVWNEEGASIKITITPPWWRTSWAYLLYGLISFVSLYILRRYERNRQRFKHQAELKHVETEKLKELDKLKSDFFANISHEFRTSLTMILGPAEQLMQESSESSKKKGKLIRRNARRLLRLINELLDLSKLENSKMQLQASPGDFIAFFKGVMMSFESWASSKEIALQFKGGQFANGQCWLAYFDWDKIEKIFFNLLSNALKFTPSGGNISVTLLLFNDRLTRSAFLRQNISRFVKNDKNSASPGDSQILIRVSDTGVGIPADSLPHSENRRAYQPHSGDSAHRQSPGKGETRRYRNRGRRLCAQAVPAEGARCAGTQTHRTASKVAATL